MNKIILEIDRYEYRNIRLLMVETIQKARESYTFNGSGNIEWKICLQSLLESRHKFKFHDEDLECFTSKTKIRISIFLFEAQAIHYLFKEVKSLSSLTKVAKSLEEDLSSYQPSYLKSEFQKYYEESLMELYDMSFTELRDEAPNFYTTLYEQFRQKSERHQLQQSEHSSIGI